MAQNSRTDQLQKRYPRKDNQGNEAARTQISQMNGRITSLDDIRSSWLYHWRELAEYILPRRYRWLGSGTASQVSTTNRGRPINQRILNSTATQAARDCASGIMSGAMSPTRPWFRLKLDDVAAMQDSDIKIWCEEVTRLMMEVMSTSNYYGSKGIQNLDLVVFGTAPLIIYEDAKDVIACFNPCAGEYYCAVDAKLEVDTLVRQFTMSAQQVANEFTDNISDTVKSLLNANGTSKDTDVTIRHMIQPNHEYDPAPQYVGSFGIPRHFLFREFYWEAGQTEKFLRVSGFSDKPFSAPRWDVSGDDAYGRSPGMDALGDIKQLQMMELRRAQAIDKIVNPPMVADVSMKNEPASLIPGAINYVPALSNTVGFKPAITVNPNLQDMMQNMAEIAARIKDVFFNDLFLMISNLDTVRSATEIDARREEKLVMLGPVMDRLQREGLAADIKRIYAIMGRRGLIPPPPDSMKGKKVKIEYISLLADLQRASITTSIERTWAFAGNIAAAKPEVLDKLDPDASLTEYGNALRAPPSIFRSDVAVKQIRAQRSAEQQRQAQIQEGMNAVQAGKVLSETDVGGGQNALSSIVNGGAPV